MGLPASRQGDGLGEHWPVTGQTATRDPAIVEYASRAARPRRPRDCSSAPTPSRVQTLGGVAVGDPRHVGEISSIARPPGGVEEVPAMLSRLLEEHEIILTEAHDAAPRSLPLAGTQPGDAYHDRADDYGPRRD
jgi:hypothetical protein